MLHSVHAQTSGHIPFMAAKVDRVYKFPTGELVATLAMTHAVRAGGSWVDRREVRANDGRSGEARLILDVSRKTRFSLNSLTESITTYPLSQKAIEQQRSRPAGCGSAQAGEHSRMLGFDVYRVVEDLPSGPEDDKVLRTETWVAPALDCFPLKSTLFIGKSKEALVEGTISEVTSIVVGEPDGGLFYVPANYVERKPSEALGAFDRMNARNPCANCPGRAALDEAYVRHRASGAGK